MVVTIYLPFNPLLCPVQTPAVAHAPVAVLLEAAFLDRVTWLEVHVVQLWIWLIRSFSSLTGKRSRDSSLFRRADNDTHL